MAAESSLRPLRLLLPLLCAAATAPPATLPGGMSAASTPPPPASSTPPAIAQAFARMQRAAANDPAEILARYLRTLATDPRDLEALTGAGRAAIDIGDANAALAFYARAEEIAPRNGRIKAGIASALVHLEKPKEALKLFDEARDLGVPEADLASDRGLAWDLRGDTKRAQKDYALALQARDDDETVRRLALSTAISGDDDAAARLLDPLLRRNDPAAWRARAFIHAMSGDIASAERVARSAMSSAQVAALRPFLVRLASLKPAQKALAVNFGEMPAEGRVYSSAQLAALDGAPLRPEAPRPADTLVPAGEPFGADGEDGPALRPTERLSTAPRRRPGEADSPNLALIGPARPAAPALPRPATKPAAFAMMSPAPVAPAPPAPAIKPARVAMAGPPPRVAAVLPPPAIKPVAPVAPVAAPLSAVPTPVGQTATIGNIPAAVIPERVRTVPILVRIPPPVVPVRLAMTMPPPTVVAPEPAIAASTPPPVEATTAPTAAPPAIVASERSPAPTDSSIAAKAAASPAAAPPAAAPPAATTVPSIAFSLPPKRPGPTSLAAVETAIAASVRAEASAAARQAAVAKSLPRADAKPAGVAKAKVEVDEKKTDGEKADKKAATKQTDEKKTAAKAKPDERKGESAKPSTGDAAERVWVQVAGGATKADLPKAWATLKGKAPPLAKGQGTVTTPLRFTNRLLVGPFKTADDAQAYVNRMSKSGLSGFVFTSAKGQEVEKLPAAQ